MKRIIILSLVTLMSLSASAQTRKPRKGGGGDINQFQMLMIARQLDLEEEQEERFMEIYSEYSKEIAEARPKHMRQGMVDSVTNEELEKQILESFDATDRSTALKREYYYRFKTVLSPSQIMKMYSIESQLRDRINSELQNRSKKQ
ncbi:MAG: hypothetical protein SNH73_01085 [Rikenellaceae bacterium]